VASAKNQHIFPPLPHVSEKAKRTCGKGIQKHLVDVHDGRSQPARRELCFFDVVKGLGKELSCHFEKGESLFKVRRWWARMENVDL
jgi:hypothetical protein